MNEEDEIDSLISDLVDMGALTVLGMDDDGELTYGINSERMKEVYPAFYDLFMEELDETLFSLYEQGFVQIEYDENLNALFSLTEKGQAEVEKMFMSDHPFDV